jgi:hypothetical protein
MPIKKLLFVVTIVGLLLVLGASTPHDAILNGLLQTDMNGGNHSITNLQGLQAAGVTYSTNGVASFRSNSLAPTSITFPASGANYTNPLNCSILIYIDNSGVTGTVVKKNGTQIFSSLVGDMTIGLQPNEYFSETYTLGTPAATYTPFP